MGVTIFYCVFAKVFFIYVFVQKQERKIRKYKRIEEKN